MHSSEIFEGLTLNVLKTHFHIYLSLPPFILWVFDRKSLYFRPRQDDREKRAPEEKNVEGKRSGNVWRAREESRKEEPQEEKAQPTQEEPDEDGWTTVRRWVKLLIKVHLDDNSFGLNTEVVLY